MSCSVSERLDGLAEAMKLSLSKMSESIGCDRGILSQIKGNANGIPSIYIEKLVQKYPDINVVYLATGEGQPLKSMENDVVQISTAKLKNTLDKIIEEASELRELIEPMTTRKICVK